MIELSLRGSLVRDRLSVDISCLERLVLVAGCDRRAGLIFRCGCHSPPEVASVGGEFRVSRCFLLVGAHSASMIHGGAGWGDRTDC